jgi:hypothetical protein
VLGVLKEMWSRGNRSWHAGGARGGTTKLGQQQCDVGNAGARQHKVERAAARQGIDAWNRREAGGGTDRFAATASGGEEQFGQTAGGVAR